MYKYYTKDGYKLYNAYESVKLKENIYIGFMNTNHFYLLIYDKELKNNKNQGAIPKIIWMIKLLKEQL